MMLLAHGASAGITNTTGDNALLMAAANGNTEVAAALLDIRSNAMPPVLRVGVTSVGITMLAPGDGRVPRSKLLATKDVPNKAGVDINLSNMQGETALKLAVWRDSVVMVMLLVAHGHADDLAAWRAAAVRVRTHTRLICVENKILPFTMPFPFLLLLFGHLIPAPSLSHRICCLQPNPLIFR